MHKQYLINEEDIEFPKMLSAKQMSGISLELNTEKLEILPQFHLGSNLDKECSIMFYNPCFCNRLTITRPNQPPPFSLAGSGAPTHLREASQGVVDFPDHRSHSTPPPHTGKIRHHIAVLLRCPASHFFLPGRCVG
jgi:hypothetical protein